MSEVIYHNRKHSNKKESDYSFDIEENEEIIDEYTKECPIDEIEVSDEERSEIKEDPDEPTLESLLDNNETIIQKDSIIENQNNEILELKNLLDSKNKEIAELNNQICSFQEQEKEKSKKIKKSKILSTLSSIYDLTPICSIVIAATSTILYLKEQKRLWKDMQEVWKVISEFIIKFYNLHTIFEEKLFKLFITNEKAQSILGYSLLIMVVVVIVGIIIGIIKKVDIIMIRRKSMIIFFTIMILTLLLLPLITVMWNLVWLWLICNVIILIIFFIKDNIKW